MSDQGNLRDRIAGVVESASFQWDTDFNAWQLGRPNSADPGPQPRRIAQAIIDELGLTVEERIDEPGKRGINPVQRIVGKWDN